MRERIVNSLVRYHEAENYLRCKNFNKGYSALIDAFYLRCTNEDYINIEFSTFFRYHFKTYLVKNHIYCIDLCAGDAIADIIRTTFEEVNERIEKSIIVPVNKWNILKETRIYI